MNIVINRRELVEGLKDVQGPAMTRQGFPALGCVLVEAEKEKVSFTTTDLDITITTSCKAKINKPGKVLIPMRRFISIARELPSGEVRLEKNKNNLLISCGEVEFKMNTLKEEEFPRIQERKEAVTIKILPEDIEEMINLTLFCTGSEDINYVLSGVLFELKKNQIKMVATDGKRLSCAAKNFPETQAEINKKITFILPHKTVAEIARVTKTKQDFLYLSCEEKTVEFDFQNTKITGRPIEGNFPGYSQYIPKKRGDILNVDREKFMASLRRAGLLSTPDHQGVKLSLRKNKMAVFKSTPQLGEVKESIEIKFDGPPLEIEFNPNYFIDALKQINDEKVTIDFFGADKPAVLRRKDQTYLLLPIKT